MERFFPEDAKGMELEAATEGIWGEAGTPGWFKGIANGWNRAPMSYAQEWPRDGWEEMSVLVGIEMRNGDTGALQLLNLGECFAFNLVFADNATQESLYEVEERRPEGFAIGAKQRGDAAGFRNRRAVGEDNMAANSESRMGVGDRDSIVEGRAGGHEGGRG